MDENRHLHFGIIQAMFFMIFFIVMINLFKYIFAKWYVPGVSELVHNA